MASGRWKKNRKFPTALIAHLKTEEGRSNLFQKFVECKGSRSETTLRVQKELTEAQRTKLKYGFRNDIWLQKHHGEKKAAKIMERKKGLGLNLG